MCMVCLCMLFPFSLISVLFLKVGEKVKMTRMMMVLCMMMVAMGLAGAKNYNELEHNALCNLMKAALHKWNQIKGKEPANPLKKALEKTLFGKDDGGKIEDLKGVLTQDYEKVQGKLPLRLQWCGLPKEGDTGENNQRWPGHSATHDLFCLCTTGQEGYPFNVVGSGNSPATKLCGQPKDALGGGSDGWDSKHRPGETEHGKDQMTATWSSVTQKCLVEDSNGKGLNEALAAFLGKLEKKKPEGKHTDRYQLGEGNADEYPCSGNIKICVMYYNTTRANYPMPWWTELQSALAAEENKSQPTPREHPQKKDEKKLQIWIPKTPPPQMPPPAALKSAPQTSQRQKKNPKISLIHSTLREQRPP
ncbi:Variant surface glycoprotein [Trypanosoma congolense IL3000]|uniref:Variant surface glycoprotein n=1 Tax=Trypanosoma congolense (strain IL3000) TaxID=1068625 RepID=F9WH79_TRYCI|nr:Variant surface glycoprotein [Trypanosoma congolense IL3000]